MVCGTCILSWIILKLFSNTIQYMHNRMASTWFAWKGQVLCIIPPSSPPPGSLPLLGAIQQSTAVPFVRQVIQIFQYIEKARIQQEDLGYRSIHPLKVRSSYILSIILLPLSGSNCSSIRCSNMSKTSNISISSLFPLYSVNRLSTNLVFDAQFGHEANLGRKHRVIPAPECSGTLGIKYSCKLPSNECPKRL